MVIQLCPLCFSFDFSQHYTIQIMRIISLHNTFPSSVLHQRSTEWKPTVTSVSIAILQKNLNSALGNQNVHLHRLMLHVKPHLIQRKDLHCNNKGNLYNSFKKSTELYRPS